MERCHGNLAKALIEARTFRGSLGAPIIVHTLSCCERAEESRASVIRIKVVTRVNVLWIN